MKDDFTGQSFLVTAGPTVENIDPVRYLSNRSSGKMGVELAIAAAERGANVILVHGPLTIPCPNCQKIKCVSVRSADQMYAAVMENAVLADVAILAAAVADFKPRSVSPKKIKKNGSDTISIDLVRTRDILAALGVMDPHPYLVGFAAESENLIGNAHAKLTSKKCDMICANDISEEGSGFGVDENRITIIVENGELIKLPLMSKKEVANRILDQVALSQICQA